MIKTSVHSDKNVPLQASGSPSITSFLRLWENKSVIENWQGNCLAWILQYRTQRRHASDVAATVVALPAKNLPWRPESWTPIFSEDTYLCCATYDDIKIVQIYR